MLKNYRAACLAIFIIILAVASTAEAQTSQPAGESGRSPGIYAIFETDMGTIVCKLFDKVAPITVANFIGLAEGTKEFIDPKTGEKTKRRYFDGTIFHRVIPKFMIQGGDLLGTGQGGPGYEFEDEIKSLRFNKPGRLAMANSGPNTNGSQFFITVDNTTWLDGKHTIFGQVFEGQEVANNISRVKRAQGDRPMFNVVLKKVTIERVE